MPLGAGDAVLLMSDGFPELFNRDHEMVGYARARDELAAVGSDSAQGILDHFHRVVENWTGSSAVNDDVTFVVLKMV